MVPEAGFGGRVEKLTLEIWAGFDEGQLIDMIDKEDLRKHQLTKQKRSCYLL